MNKENFNWKNLVSDAVKARKSSKLTQAQMSVISGVSLPTYINFEKGRESVRIGSALKILKALGLCENN